MKNHLVALLIGLAAPASALQHTVVPGDHLWGLAGKYYQNHFRWKVIYAANRDKIKDPHWIYPGQVFEIPEVPNAAIGELPARPVESEPAAAAPQDTLEQAEAAAAPPPVEAAKAGPPAKTDDLSTEMPQGQAGMYPSVSRTVADKSWKEDGKITEFDGREALAAQGDWVVGKAPAVREGDMLTVYRRVARQSLDTEKDKTYLAVIGQVQAKAQLGKGRWRFYVTKSGDSVQVGDLLKMDGR